MKCKRCGSPLPSQGYVCNQCGMLMDKNQIEIQKEYLKQAPLQTTYLSEKYGSKKPLFEGRESKENNYGVLLFLFILLVIIVIMIGIGLILLK